MIDDTPNTSATLTTGEGASGSSPPPWLPERYVLLSLLGQGGMGQVWQVRDRVLDRVMALKVVAGQATPERAARLAAEARLTAQLQHPGIPPVHDLGELPDGRTYFTMQEIRGTTLAELIRAHHARDPQAWTKRRLLDALLRAAEAVAYAHGQGVLHGDLKPANIMLGAFGAVMVVDWGLAVRRDHGVRGTPHYMAPEQARGAPPSRTSDVFALGAVLHQIVVGAPRVRGRSASEVLARLRAGELEPLPPLTGLGAECAPVIERATQPEPEARYADGLALAEALQEVLDGAKRRAEASKLLAQAQEALPRVPPLRQRAAELRAQATRALERVALHEPTARRLPAWALEDEAAALEAEAQRTLHEVSLHAEAALRHAPDLRPARALLAQLQREALLEAEAEGDAEAAARAERALRRLDAPHQVEFLEGRGRLTLLTDPPGAEVLVSRYALHERRLVPAPEGRLGQTPLSAPMEMGSYLLTLRHPGCEDVRYPVYVERQQQLTGAPPGASEPLAIPLPPAGSLTAEERYVPPGWFIAGGDTEVPGGEARQRVWVDGFVLSRTHVTHGQYITFLDALVASGREALALRCVPRADTGTGADAPPMLYGRDAAGHFILVPDAEGDVWEPDHAATKIDWYSACHYARWRGEQDGHAWRLPTELEWAKAARGVDGRAFPWGDVYDHPWALTARSRPGRSLPAGVESFPVDESPYGVRGLAGNAREWCLDGYAPGGPRVIDGRAPRPAPAPLEPEDLLQRRAVRGGCFSAGPYWCRAAVRDWMAAGVRMDSCGFRLARAYPEEP